MAFTATSDRPSLFRTARGLRFQTTTCGGNLHCSSIPQQLLRHSIRAEIKLHHLGYMHRADRLRKFEWYNRVDPNNTAEDCYRHVVQGDVPEVPADMKLRHAGPLTLKAFA